jgi:hypothetical protein
VEVLQTVSTFLVYPCWPAHPFRVASKAFGCVHCLAVFQLGGEQEDAMRTTGVCSGCRDRVEGTVGHRHRHLGCGLVEYHLLGENHVFLHCGACGCILCHRCAERAADLHAFGACLNVSEPPSDEEEPFPHLFRIEYVV